MSHSNTPAQSDPIKIQQVPVAALEPDPRNARTHSKQQIRQIAASIREFGFVNPILIDEANRIIAGVLMQAQSKRKYRSYLAP